MRSVCYVQRFAHWLAEAGVPLIPLLLSYLIRFVYGAWVPAGVTLGRGTQLGYGGLGIVIHDEAVIGRDCLIGTGVTIGGGAGGGPGTTGTGVPRLGDEVQVGTGAKVLGGVVVGDRALIGANAVVIADVPAGVIVGGVPARVIRERGADE